MTHVLLGRSHPLLHSPECFRASTVLKSEYPHWIPEAGLAWMMDFTSPRQEYGVLLSQRRTRGKARRNSTRGTAKPAPANPFSCSTLVELMPRIPRGSVGANANVPTYAVDPKRMAKSHHHGQRGATGEGGLCTRKPVSGFLSIYFSCCSQSPVSGNTAHYIHTCSTSQILLSVQLSSRRRLFSRYGAQ